MKKKSQWNFLGLFGFKTTANTFQFGNSSEHGQDNKTMPRGLYLPKLPAGTEPKQDHAISKACWFV